MNSVQTIKDKLVCFVNATNRVANKEEENSLI